jgi:hypothetical protein
MSGNAIRALLDATVHFPTRSQKRWSKQSRVQRGLFAAAGRAFPLLPGSCQIIARLLPDNCQTVARQLPDCCQTSPKVPPVRVILPPPPPLKTTGVHCLFPMRDPRLDKQ